MDPIPYAPVRYDRERHEAFVRTSWTLGARQPWKTRSETRTYRSRRGAVQELQVVTPGLYDMMREGARCVVAHAVGDPDSLLGWACVEAGGAVVWVYVRDFPSCVRRRGIGTSLLLDAGADVSTPTPCLYWSPYAAILAARGYRVFYAPYERNAA